MSDPQTSTTTPAALRPEDLCYVVSYDHGGLVLWGADHFVHHFRDLLGWFDRHPKLKMGLDNEAWMYDWLADNQPAVLDEIKAALRDYPGRLGIATCTYGQPLGAFILEESNIRQIMYGIDATKERLGYTVDIYSFSEHHAFPQLPQILVSMGIRGSLMRTHYLMYGFCPGYDVPIAWWQSPDGSRVPCVPTYIHQERQVKGHNAHPPGPYGLTTEDTWILTRYPSDISPHSLDTFRERFSHIRPLLATRLDDSGLKCEGLVDELDTRDDYRWATLEDVFNEFPAPTEVIAPTAEDLRPRMPWGYRGNELFDLARRAEITVLIAERLVAVSAANAPELDPEFIVDPLEPGYWGEWDSAVSQAWKNALVGQHHDIQIVARSGGMGRELLLESLQQSRVIIRTLLTERCADNYPPAYYESLFDLDEDGTTLDPATLERIPTGDNYVAFNPLPWARTEPTVELPDGMLLHGPVSAPALGFAQCEIPIDTPGTPASLAFETDCYKVSFNFSGGLESLATRDGRALLKAGSGRLAGVIDGIACESEGTATVAKTSAGYRVIEKGKIGTLAYTTRWIFPDHGHRIEYHVSMRFDGGERVGHPTTARNDSHSCFVHEEKLRARFYPAIESADAFGVYDTPFGVQTTQRPYIEGNYWTALADNSGGLAIANRGTMGSVREDDGAFSVALAFSTNYIWGMEPIGGLREWGLGLLPFTENWEAAALHRKSLEFAFPIVVIPGALKDAGPEGLTIDNPNVHLTAYYAEGQKRFMRFFNGSDSGQTIPLGGFAPATPVDLRHNEVGKGLETLVLKPWQIVTVQVATGGHHD